MTREEIRALGFMPIPNSIMSRSDITASEKVVLAYLIDSLRDNATCWPSPPVIAKAIGSNRRSVQRSLDRLRKTGIVTVVGHKKNNANEYCVTIPGSANLTPPELGSANQAQRQIDATSSVPLALPVAPNRRTIQRKSQREDSKESAAPLPVAVAPGLSSGQVEMGAKLQTVQNSVGQIEADAKYTPPQSHGEYSNQANPAPQVIGEKVGGQPIPSSARPLPAQAERQPNSQPASEPGPAVTDSANPGCRQSGTAPAAPRKRQYDTDAAAVAAYWLFGSEAIKSDKPADWLAAGFKTSKTNWQPNAKVPADFAKPAADVSDQALAAFWTFRVACLRHPSLPIEKPNVGRLVKQVKQLAASIGRQAVIDRIAAIYSRWSEIRTALSWHLEHGLAVDEQLLFNPKVKGVLENSAATSSPTPPVANEAVKKLRQEKSTAQVERIYGKTN